MARAIDNIRRMIEGAMSAPPVATLIGFRVTAIEPGRATVELEAGQQHANPMGTLHGGVLCDVADAAKMGRTVGMVECDVTDESVSLVARASSTCMTLRGNQAAGR